MRFIRFATLAVTAITLNAATPALAHCDGLDGPVVAAARTALDIGNPNPVLIWVQPKDEAEIRAAFAQTLDVRKQGAKAKSMADSYFFETLVRLHRAGEGAPYTGLKPAGRDLGPAIPLADKAVASGSDRELADFVAKSASDGVKAHFADLQRKRNFRPDDIAAGRAYVASYVTFVHYVEGLHQAAEAKTNGHYPETRQAPAHHD
jgi:hypothetical protein